MADPVASIDAVGRTAELLEKGPLAFAGAVGWLVAGVFIVLYVRINSEVRELTVQLITSANLLGDTIDKLEAWLGRRVPRRRKPTTNPGFKLPPGPESSE